MYEGCGIQSALLYEMRLLRRAERGDGRGATRGHSGVTSAAGSVASESNERAALAVHQATSILDVWYRAIYYALVLARVSGCVGRARAGQPSALP